MRYVVLQFSDDAAAAEFVQAVENNEAVGDEKLHHVFYGVPKDAADPRGGGLMIKSLDTSVFVRAMYQAPTKYCDCGIEARAKAGFALSKKYKWWVHAQCGKPNASYAAMTFERAFSTFGKNLLPVSERAPEWRGEGKQAFVWSSEHQRYVIRKIEERVQKLSS